VFPFLISNGERKRRLNVGLNVNDKGCDNQDDLKTE